MHSEKGRANKLRTLSSFEKYKINIDDVRGKRRYSRNILQKSKNDFESKNTTNGDYCFPGKVAPKLPRPKVGLIYTFE